ncbi:MAG: tetratricopeptide repeat protein, partial [Cyanobacteria bacterium]|nr:tetratricopeptide repeat protein [Cyanobacteriota bacterium]
FVAANINMALSLNQLGEFRQAVDAATQALRFNSTSSYALYHRGCARIELGQFAEASEDFTRAIADDPGNPGYYLQRARCYERMGQNQKANADFAIGAKLPGKTVSENLFKAAAYYGQGQFEKAIPVFTLTIKQDPTCINAIHDRGLCYATTGKYKEAINDYTRCLKINPEYYHCYYLRAAAKLMSGDNSGASSDFNKHLSTMKWRGSHAPYSVMMCTIADRKLKNDKEANALLTQANRTFASQSWPAPIIQYLSGKLSGGQLEQACGGDVDRLTEMRAYVGLNLSSQGNSVQAIKQLSWVKEYGNRKFSEYRLATTELARLNKKTIAGK